MRTLPKTIKNCKRWINSYIYDLKINGKKVTEEEKQEVIKIKQDLENKKRIIPQVTR